MRFFSRLSNYIRGVLARWMNRRETRDPEAVYEAAIQERVEQYSKLRQAAAGVLYMRSKLERELDVKGKDLRRLGTQLEVAIDRGDDEAALALIQRRDSLSGEVDRLSAERTELAAEAEIAKRNLVDFRSGIEGLREEKTRAIVRLRNAKARLRLQATLSGLSPDADIQALETVRDHVEHVVQEVALSTGGGDGELERRLGKIRAAEAETAALLQLEELKRARRNRLLPVSVSVPSESARTREQRAVREPLRATSKCDMVPTRQ